jgi:ubiquinone/menaquinone biosynthesis C-methylase UbiE
MNRLLFLWRISERFLSGHRTELADIARDYDQASATYGDTWQAFMEPVNKAFLGTLSPPPDGHILDLGCGTGLVLRHLRERGFRGAYTGIDASGGMLAQIQEEPGVERIHGDVHSLLSTFPARCFDAVTALWSWEYMDRESLLPQIRRVLRPGGQLLLLANRRDTVPELEEAFLRLMARRPRDIRKVFHLALRMPRSAARMAQEATRAGFQVDYAADGERIQCHSTAAEAIAWGFRTGALAGTRCVMELEDLESHLARMLEEKSPASHSFSTTHRFAGVAGSIPC